MARGLRGNEVISYLLIGTLLIQWVFMVPQGKLSAEAPDVTPLPITISAVTVSSNADTAGNLLDGDQWTNWYSEWGQNPAWIKLDLGQPYRLTDVELDARYDVTLYESEQVTIYGANSEDYSDRVQLARTADEVTEVELLLPITDANAYRYMMIETTVPQTHLGFSEVVIKGVPVEIEVPPAGQVITVDAVTVSSNADTAGNLLDGDQWTNWYSEWGQNPAWIKLDLGQPYRLTDVELDARYDVTLYESEQVTIYGANSEDYSDRVQLARTADEVTEVELSLPITDANAYRYVMIETTVPQTHLGFSEVVIKGVLPSAPPVEPRNAFYVSPDGDDSNPGTVNEPFRTLEAARNAVRVHTATMDSDIHVYLRGGVYPSLEAIEFTPLDSGRNGYEVVYEAYPDEVPILDGGVSVEGQWTAYGNAGILRVQLDESIVDMREMVVDGKRQQRAVSQPIKSAKVDGDLKKAITSNAGLPSSGFAHPEDLFYSVIKQWRHYILPIHDIVRGDEYSVIQFEDELISMYINNHNYMVDYNNYFVLENALELLDEPSEWYYDKRTHMLYYMPEAHVSMGHAEVKVPQTEEFIQVKGSSNSNRVENLRFEGIHFVNATWAEANERGMASAQSNTIVNEDGPFNNVIPAAFNVNLASNITIHRNTFERIGKSAINAEKGIANVQIVGNIFNDIAGTAISIGSPTHDSLARAGDNLPRDITVSNNVLREIATQFWGAAAIAAYYYDGLDIVHNDIQGTNYTGVSVGWGWSATVDSLRNLKVNHNRIDNFNRKVTDGAAIYSLSSHVNAQYSGNYVKNANGSFNAGGLYHDERSSNFTDTNNVIELERGDYAAYNLNVNTNITVDNLYTTSGNIVNYEPGPNVAITNVHIVPDANWPPEALAIIASAGLESDYQDLLAKVVPILDQEDLPHLVSSGVYFLDARLFNPYSTRVNKEIFEAPFVEANGLVAFDASEYTGYTGTEVADYSYLGWVNAPTNNSAKYAMITHPKQMTREPIQSDVKPELSYDVQFTAPGQYLVYVLAKEGNVKVGHNGEEVGTIAFGASFSWQHDDVMIDIDAAGVHTLSIWNTNTNNSIERVVLTKAATEFIYEGSTSIGPPTSPKQGFPYIAVPSASAYPVFSADTGMNAAIGKPTAASSTLEGYSSAHVVDGLSVTGWRSSSSDQTAWWQVDLEQAVRLKKIEVHFLPSATDMERSQFEVRGSNDEDFTQYDVLGSQQSVVPSGDYLTILPTDELKQYRYIRIQKTVDNAPLALSEMRIMDWQPVMANVALDKPIETSSSTGQAQLLVDEDVNELSGWVSDEEDRPWIRLDLQEAYSLNHINLIAASDSSLDALRDLSIFGANEADLSDKRLVAVVDEHSIANGRSFELELSDTSNYRYIFIQSELNQVRLHLAEIEVYGMYPVPDNQIYLNIAQGKQTYATSAYSSSYVADHAVDGNANTSFVVKNWGNQEYFQLDLGQSYSLNKVQIVPRVLIDDWERKGFVVLASNDAAFAKYRTIGEVGSEAFGEGQIWSAQVTNPTPFRYLRVHKTDNQGIGFAELRVLIAQESITMQVGDILPLFARMNGEDMLKQPLTWSSSNPDVISVSSNGVAVGKSAGQATVTAAYSGQSVSIQLEIPKIYRTVSFDSNGGSTVDAQQVELNQPATEPAAPTKIGYTFAGWYTAEDEGYAFSAAVTANITLYAKWTVIASGGGNEPPVRQAPGTSSDSDHHEFGSIVHSVVNGQRISKIIVDEQKLATILEGVKPQSVIRIQASEDSDGVSVQVSAQELIQLAQAEVIVEISNGNATYRLPIEQLNLDSIAKQLGSSVEASAIQLQVDISTLANEQQEALLEKMDDGSYRIVSSMIEYTVRATYGETSLEISHFNVYIERTITLPVGVDPSSVKTAVVVDPDGTIRPVPTKIEMREGKQVAVIQSLTNSVYALVSTQPSLDDIKGHWAQAVIEDMLARMIINGVGQNQFKPNQDITRGEFAAILVRALGLKPDEGQTPFSDVNSSDWYQRAVQTAHARNLVNGYEDGTFRPNEKITREQAMLILARAMKVTGLSEKLSTSGANEVWNTFVDSSTVSAWAAEGVRDSLISGIVSGRNGHVLALKANITRAEVVVMMKRLLTRSELI